MDEADVNFDIVKRHTVDAVKRHFSTFILTDIAFFNVKLIFIRIVSNMFFLSPSWYLLVQRHWRPSGVFIVNFEHISHLVLVFLLLTLNI